MKNARIRAAVWLSDILVEPITQIPVSYRKRGCFFGEVGCRQAPLIRSRHVPNQYATAETLAPLEQVFPGDASLALAFAAALYRKEPPTFAFAKAARRGLRRYRADLA
jgi:hypothetical protein